MNAGEVVQVNGTVVLVSGNNVVLKLADGSVLATSSTNVNSVNTDQTQLKLDSIQNILTQLIQLIGTAANNQNAFGTLFSKLANTDGVQIDQSGQVTINPINK